jgi:hypothetical protein
LGFLREAPLVFKQRRREAILCNADMIHEFRDSI